MKLIDTPLGTPEEFNVVVEIPKGSDIKYEYDEATDKVIPDFYFKDGLKFINNYGFIPHTLAGDGDAVDVLILNAGPLEPGTVVTCRPIGLMEQLDRGQQDNKVLAMPKDDLSINSINDISEEQREAFRKFYAEVARQKNKVVEILGFHDKDWAIEEIKKAAV